MLHNCLMNLRIMMASSQVMSLKIRRSTLHIILAAEERPVGNRAGRGSVLLKRRQIEKPAHHVVTSPRSCIRAIQFIDTTLPRYNIETVSEYATNVASRRPTHNRCAAYIEIKAPAAIAN